MFEPSLPMRFCVFTSWTVHITASPSFQSIQSFPISGRTFQILRIFGESSFATYSARFAVILMRFAGIRNRHVFEANETDTITTCKVTQMECTTQSCSLFFENFPEQTPKTLELPIERQSRDFDSNFGLAAQFYVRILEFQALGGNCENIPEGELPRDRS